MNPSKKSFFSSGTVVVPAGKTVPYHCTGQMFICKEASNVFWISFDDGEFFKHEVGLGFRMKGDDFFSRLQFRNDTADSITIEFYAGAGEIMDNRLNTTINRLMIVSLKDSTDYTSGYDNALLEIGTIALPSLTLSGTDPATGKQRRQVVITNMSSSEWLLIEDDSGNYFAAVGPLQSWTMQTSGILVLKKYGSVAVETIVGQTYYEDIA